MVNLTIGSAFEPLALARRLGRAVPKLLFLVPLTLSLQIAHFQLIGAFLELNGLLVGRVLRLSWLLTAPLLAGLIIAILFAFPLVKTYPRRSALAALLAVLPTLGNRLPALFDSSRKPFVIAAIAIELLAVLVLVPLGAWLLSRKVRRAPARAAGAHWTCAALPRTLGVMAALLVAGVSLMLAFITVSKLHEMAQVRGWVPGGFSRQVIVSSKLHQTQDESPDSREVFWLAWEGWPVTEPGTKRVNVLREQWEKLDVGDRLDIVHLTKTGENYVKDGIYESSGQFLLDLFLLAAELVGALYLLQVLRDEISTRRRIDVTGVQEDWLPPSPPPPSTPTAP